MTIYQAWSKSITLHETRKEGMGAAFLSLPRWHMRCQIAEYNTPVKSINAGNCVDARAIWDARRRSGCLTLKFRRAKTSLALLSIGPGQVSDMRRRAIRPAADRVPVGALSVDFRNPRGCVHDPAGESCWCR